MADLRILTWNLYLGGDISRIFGSGLATLPGRLGELWRIVQSTDFAARAKVLATCIAAARPDVLALQEAFRWAAARPGRMPPGAPDFLELLVAALADRGVVYDLAARSAATPLWLPAEGTPGVWMQDAQVILVRRDSAWTAADPLAGRFATCHHVTFAGHQFPIDRGWVAADLRRDGRRVRLVCTHLEYFKPEVQLPQLDEILAGPAVTDDPMVLAGDFNSGPGSPVWQRLAAAGFVDGWVGQGIGATSGQAEDLRNPVSQLADRIDAVFARGGPQGGLVPVEAEVTGHRATDRTPGGLWPSDHAGVVVGLRF